MSNVVLNPGVGGATLATDTIGGVEWQYVKVDIGAAGASSPVTAANPLPTSAAQSGAWNITNVSGTVSLPTGAATSAKQPALGTAGTASTDVLTIQGIASMTKLLVTPDSVALPANQSVNVSQINAVTPLMGNGVTGTGSPRVTIASDNTAFTVNAAQSGSWSLAANQSVNVAQINGVTPLMGTGASGTGSHRVTIATDGQGQLVDNAGFTDGTTRVDVAGFIFDDVAGTALTENDVAAARVDSKRALMVTLEDATTRAQKLAISSAGAASANTAQIAGTTTAVNNGTASAGCQRVTIASDNTAFSVNATSKTGTSGGYTTATGSIAATKTDIKGSAGQVYGWYFYNPNASVAYVQFFNATAANVTLGTTAPVYSLGIPATSAANVFNDHGIPHGTAISIAVTTTRAGSTGTGSTVDYNIWYA